MNELITGDQHAIASGPYRAVITEAGASLRELTHEDRPLILAHPEDEIAPAAFGQLLIPWPNRIDHGRYTYGGKTYQLDISEPKFDCAIHGLVRWAPWALAELQSNRVLLTARLLGSGGYPFRLDLEAEYTLDPGEGLTVRLSATNTGRSPAPYGHGAHPYITVGEALDGCTLSIPGDRYLAVNDRMIPDGPPRKVEGSSHDFREARTLGDLKIDNAYTGLSRDGDGRAWVHLTGAAHTTSFWLDERHPWLEIFTADTIPADLRRQGLGVEPMTCPPDAFNSGTDLIDLAPGDQFSGTWGIKAG
ncbi:aldose 1-epimerase family protein [Actinomadura barringtoniae]|uniref:Aldose 1-epimerase family protein n=1 Tax=Actinomadura barringtoniae TaxID=1427535 RepID=A0A939PGU6_9ACTN|nr:aldose 1-epimerase family protein [Actinomadura barringtoniae]MBO2452400.1 aldose 1-epimerase family protein [Actinomadura barringtoniae]